VEVAVLFMVDLNAEEDEPLQIWQRNEEVMN
jgi:hypothetical protein